MNADPILSTSNPVFMAFATWSGILILKMMAMTLLTSFQRIRTKTVANPEDWNTGLHIRTHEDVERVRRAHLNDMENVLPYLMVAFLYVLTRPDPYLATILFGIAAVARFIHTYVYAIHVIKQPARALMFHIHWWIMLYMIIVAMVYFFKF